MLTLVYLAVPLKIAVSLDVIPKFYLKPSYYDLCNLTNSPEAR
jgi:hypothetical protein